MMNNNNMFGLIISSDNASLSLTSNTDQTTSISDYVLTDLTVTSTGMVLHSTIQQVSPSHFSFESQDYSSKYSVQPSSISSTLTSTDQYSTIQSINQELAIKTTTTPTTSTLVNIPMVSESSIEPHVEEKKKRVRPKLTAEQKEQNKRKKMDDKK